MTTVASSVFATAKKREPRTRTVSRMEALNVVQDSTLALREESEQLHDWMVEIRRDLHAHPELGMQEFRTRDVILRELEKIEGVNEIRRVSKTGVVAEVAGLANSATTDGQRDRIILLRADMDALAMQDLKGEECPYRSQNEGVCHSCGHDVHVTCQLGAARLLASRRRLFSGKVLLVFQPAEEMAIGARLMLSHGIAGKFSKKRAAEESEVGSDDEDNWSWLPEDVEPLPDERYIPGETKVLRKPGWVRGSVVEPNITAALSMHVETVRDVGYVAVKNGPMYASCDDFHITIVGRGGHAGFPTGAVNPLFTACNVIVALNSWLSRSVSSSTPCVLTFCHIDAGTTTNVIPESCLIEGTMRTHSEKLRAELVERLPIQIRMLAASFGARAEVTVRRSFSAGANDPLVSGAVRKSAITIIGEDHVVDVETPAMGSEDFFEFSCDGKVPAAMFWLGAANSEKGIIYDNHNAHFDIDERCLQVGAAVQAATALRLLTKDILVPVKNIGGPITEKH